ncbi:hypothetical protein NQZ79_g996 [Umbelopsis isabellina]|nr:hypothetical protein NQZ79_g996 [Umbelopsis isabellina]
MIFSGILLLLLIWRTIAFKLPSSGTATITHYLLGDNVGACDCAIGANKYPVAAINQNAFGVVNGTAGPGCGRCFQITLTSAISSQNYTISDPSKQPNVVVKVVDNCPALDPNLGKSRFIHFTPGQLFIIEWCAQTDTQPNPHGAWVHFDISQTTIPSNFFPQPFGYDIGEWLSTYSEVSCEQWEGYNKPQTSGLQIADSGCCPANPTFDNQTCPMSGSSGTVTSMSPAVQFDVILALIFVFISFITCSFY